MASSSIRILPPEAPQPETGCPPVDGARRWDSPYDGYGLYPVVSVYMSQVAFSRIGVHAASDPDFEVGGILIGHWCAHEDGIGQYVSIEQMLPARYTRQGSAYLTFTQDTLVDVLNRIESQYPDKRIVGWYHTHPRMGLFLSRYDTWLHNSFFPEPWQVALVVEPHTSIGGVFIRQKNGSLDSSRYFGFYEVNGAGTEGSIVNWHNLHSPTAFLDDLEKAPSKPEEPEEVPVQEEGENSR
ncbi:MAG: hypothetical protein AB1846_01675 [Chloroflexota bacterium]